MGEVSHNSLRARATERCKFKISTCLLAFIVTLVAIQIASVPLSAAGGLDDASKRATTNVSNARLTRAPLTQKARSAPGDTSKPINKPTNTTTIDSSKSSSQSIVLVLKDDSTHKYRHLRDKLDRHTYNVTAPPSNVTAPIVSSKRANSSSSGADLGTSDSRLIPHLMSLRASDDPDALSEDDSPPDEMDDSVTLDEASSNLNHQRVVKELTKILSKGMSGATDHARLETLENWKRRQKERKAMKESRAKLYENLLTAAIQSHPKQARKKSKNRQGGGGSGGSGGGGANHDKDGYRSSSASPGLASNPDIDPGSAMDAENIVHQIQGLASIIDRDPAGAGAGMDLSGASEDSSNETESSDESLSSEPLDEREKTPKRPSTERPILRKFKRIKQQISNRRRQLDQIKKLFNVELALDPKDGSLVGRSASKKKERDNEKDSELGVKEVGDFTVIDDHGGSSGASSNKRRTSFKSSQMKNLMGYLRENPDVLASVMAELTTETDPTRPDSRDNYSADQDGGSSAYSTTLEQGDYPQSSARKLSSRAPDPNRHDYDPNFNAGRPRGSSKYYDQSKQQPQQQRPQQQQQQQNQYQPMQQNQQQYDPPEPGSERRSRRFRESLGRADSSPPPRTSVSQAVASLLDTPKHKMAEAMLLESLRERQLLNLARLEVMMAERLQASNRSHTYSTANSTFSPTITRQDGRNVPSQSATSSGFQDQPSQQSNSYQQYQQQHPQPQQQPQPQQHQNQQSRPYQNHSQSNEEVQHHFMVMQNSNPSDINRFSDSTVAGPGSSWQPPEYSTNSQVSSSLYGPAQAGPIQPSTLGRFNSWRDVSQTEMGLSQRQDKANIAWAPDDLTPGGSVASVESYSSASSPMSVRPMQGGVMNSTSNYAQTNNQLQVSQQQSFADHSDLSVTRPGVPSPPVNRPEELVRQAVRPMMNTPMMNPPTMSAPLMNPPMVTPPMMNSAPLARSEMNAVDSSNQQARQESIKFQTSVSPDRPSEGRYESQGNFVRNLPEQPAIEEMQPAREEVRPAREENRPIPPGHVDYFSAYKHEWPSGEPGERRRDAPDTTATRKTSHGSRPETFESNNDEMGAMWAR